jgi:hypothetical protein
MAATQTLLTIAARNDAAPFASAAFDASNQSAVTVRATIGALVGACTLQLFALGSDAALYPVAPPIALAVGQVVVPVGIFAFQPAAGNPVPAPLAQTLVLVMNVPGGASVSWSASVEALESTAVANTGPVAAPLPPPTVSQLVYVSKGGSDITGNGTEAAPFLTIAKAYASILDAAVGKRYAILVGPGEYAASFNFKPWIALCSWVTSFGSNGADPNGESVVEIQAPANSIHFDAAWGVAFGVAWFEGLAFTFPQTFNQADVAGCRPQLNFGGCLFNGSGGAGPALTFIGPGTAGVDNVTIDTSFAYGAISCTGWQFLWTRNFQTIGGTMAISSVAGAAEDTTWLAMNCAIGQVLPIANGTNVSLTGIVAGHFARAELYNTTVVSPGAGGLSMTNSTTSYRCNPDALCTSAPITLAGGAPAPIVNGPVGQRASLCFSGTTPAGTTGFIAGGGAATAVIKNLPAVSRSTRVQWSITVNADVPGSSVQLFKNGAVFGAAILTVGTGWQGGPATILGLINPGDLFAVQLIANVGAGTYDVGVLIELAP